MTDVITIIVDEGVSVSVGDMGLKGRPGIVWRESWSAELDYYVGDVAKYNGSAFICTSFIAANASAYPISTPNSWSILISGVTDARDIEVEASGDLPSGSLQDVLKHLEDQIFTSAATPTGPTTDEGDLWYDTSTDQMKFLRNGVWEVLVQTGATADTNGYDSVNLNGGYF